MVRSPLITSALANSGHPYAGERLLLETETPSWLSTVSRKTAHRCMPLASRYLRTRTS